MSARLTIAFDVLQYLRDIPERERRALGRPSPPP